MIGQSPEVLLTEEEKTDSGFSEKRAARLLEGKKMDNSQVKKRKPIVLAPKQKLVVPRRDANLKPKQPITKPQQTLKDKIVTAHKENARQLISLVETLGDLATGSIRQEENLLAEIRKKQKIQEELLNALLMESKGQLHEQALSKDVRDLIK